MSISLKTVLENHSSTVSKVISRRLNGVSRGLGFWAAWDAVSSLGDVVALVLSVAVITYSVTEIIIGILQ